MLSIFRKQGNPGNWARDCGTTFLLDSFLHSTFYCGKWPKATIIINKQLELIGHYYVIAKKNPSLQGFKTVEIFRFKEIAKN